MAMAASIIQASPLSLKSNSKMKGTANNSTGWLGGGTCAVGLGYGLATRKSLQIYNSSFNATCSEAQGQGQTPTCNAPTFPRSRVWNPYKRLGVSPYASEEEIWASRNFLLEQYAGHERSQESIEGAFEKLLMSSFIKMNKTKINLKTRLKKKVDESPPWLKALLHFVEMPPMDTIFRRLFLFAFMAGWSIINSAEGGPAFQVAVSLAACIYFLNDKTKSLGRACIIGIGALVLGWVCGSIVIPMIPTFLIHPTWTLELLTSLELDYLVGAVSNPKRPFAAIVGGSKVSSKIGVIESLLEKCDILLLGGGMIFTFYKAQGLSVGSSLVEEDKLELATSLLAKAKERGVSLLLPTDVVIADKFAPDANSKIVAASAIPDGWMGLDIGPDSIKTFNEALDTTQTVIWNGPMGVFEFEKFAQGTEAVANKLAELSKAGVTTIIGGGDSVAAVEKVGVAGVMSHIWTGGGASLELLEGKVLPGVVALDEATTVTV